MNKRQARHFAIGSTVVAAVIFIGLTIDSHRQFGKLTYADKITPAVTAATSTGLTIASHRQFGKLTNADKITPAVTRGKDVWHANNCINCHTVFGEGAYYAPDLTKITKHRGEAYLRAYMKDPSKFY